MGEVVVSGHKVVEATEVEEKESSGAESKSGGGGELKNGLMKWEKFLPRMILRVLLVEADDSTRQIIAALLRKCSYRVAAVPDGLKAWEILKRRSQNIDLILTEVDLPSISGYALLTLIMEHEICKNIPVIMMSSEDSISTVYKCMLRGAADYLVKPIRKNELRNLWQHVWRRQSSTIGVIASQDESVAQEKVEATAENNAASRSSGDSACIQRNKELIEKGSDAQSSCTKPDLEAESARVDELPDLPQLKHGELYPSEIKMQGVEMGICLGQKSIKHDSNAEGLTMAITNKTCGKDGGPEDHRSACTTGEAHDNHYIQISSAREAVDLSGAFLTGANCGLNSSSVDCTGKFDFSLQLDLSLRRSHPNNFENEATEERHTLMHSDASAFKWYTSRKVQAPPAAFANLGSQQREQRTNREKNISNIATSHNSDSPTCCTQRNIVSPATGQSKESELATSDPQHGISHPIPVKGIRFNDLRTAYGSVIPPFFSAQSAPPSMPSPTSVAQFKPTFQVNAVYQPNIKENSSGHLYEPHGQKTNNAMPTNHIVYIPEHKSENIEDRGHISSATDQSACSSFCNGNASQLNSIGYGSNCGSNGNVDQVALARTASEGRNEDLTNNGVSHRSCQREVALNKFRLKRKERCYEKKIRYESRKKLAEQRPRIKGQFVRQANPDPQAADKDG